MRVARTMQAGLERLGHEVEIFPSAREPGLVEHRGRFLFWPGFDGMRELMGKISKADIVHIHGLWTLPTTMAGRFAYAQGRPYVITPHGMLDKWSMKRSRLKKGLYAALLERRNIELCAGLHFLNDEEAAEAHSFIGAQKTFVIPNGIDMAVFSKAPGAIDLQTIYPDIRASTVVLFLGRIHEKKGLDILIPALKKTLDQGVDVHLLIAGPDEGGYQGQIERLVDQYGVRHAVTFTGEVHDEKKQVLLKNCDFFVLPSYQEGDSVAVKEALAAGLPVLITYACHLHEVQDSMAGIVCDTDIDQVAAGITKLAGNESLRMAMSSNAKKLIVEKYRSDVLLSELECVYRDILEK